MMSKQKIIFIVIAIAFVYSLCWNLVKFAPESNNYEIYKQALTSYDNHEYQKAYSKFSKVTKYSQLKAPALYRQALCAEKSDNHKKQEKKFKAVIKKVPNTNLALRSKYLLAQLYFDQEKYSKASKEFKKIALKYPDTDYGAAAQYYLGAIDFEKFSKTKLNFKKKKYKDNSVKSFKNYVKAYPDGKFAIDCAEKWTQIAGKLTNEDNLLIAKVYIVNKDYKNAEKYLSATNLSVSWPYFVETAYAQRQFSKVKFYTEAGLQGKGQEQVLINQDLDETEENKNIYKAVDKYLKLSVNPRLSISYLLSISNSAKGHDYLLYKTCKNLPSDSQTACFNSLYYKYPDGQFAAEALSNMFYDKFKSQNYHAAKKLGQIHLNKFADTKSAPKVMFWLAKLEEKNKNYDTAKSYYKKVIKQFPDDYYAYNAFLCLNRFRIFNIVDLKEKPVEFPYKNNNYAMLTALLKVNDYGLINQLYKNDDFINSWLNYKQGNFSLSAKLARDAMDNLPQKPNRFDLRWRLVYPQHYYDEIKRDARIRRNDSALILAIIREESYFNPNAKSPVGARGLMQLMPATAQEAAVKNGIFLPNPQLLYDPNTNIKLGNIYYANLKKMLMNKDVLAVLAYNGGIGSVSRWKNNIEYESIDDFVEQIPYSETQNYLKKVYKSYWNYIRIYDGVKF